MLVHAIPKVSREAHGVIVSRGFVPSESRVVKPGAVPRCWINDPPPTPCWRASKRRTGARLRVYIGAAPGVGKTYEMLQEAHALRASGLDVVIGFVETYDRRDTQAQLKDLEVIPRRNVEYRGTTMEEMDVDAIIQRRPQVCVVDELAHTNVPGSRHAKRYEDVLEILDAGIHVMTAVNIQHLETLNDAVARATGVRVRETVPDTFLDRANEVINVDVTVEELRNRLREGKIYRPEKVEQALTNFFRKGNLSTLRELALRAVADEVGEKAASYRAREGLEPALIPERVMVCMSSNALAPRVIRTGARIAGRLGSKWYAVYVETPREKPDRINHEASEALQQNIRLAETLGATVVRVKAARAADGLIAFAQREGVTHVIFGQTARTRWELLWRESTLDRVSERHPRCGRAGRAAAGGAVMSTHLPTRRDRPAHIRRLRRWMAVGLLACIALVAGLVVIAPAGVCLGAALVAAVSWSVWLERHPEGAANRKTPHTTQGLPRGDRPGANDGGEPAVVTALNRPIGWWPLAIVATMSMAVAGCNQPPAIERLSQARHHSADLHIQFTAAADAANRAVMADTDEASAAFAREAEQAKEAVQAQIDALQALLRGLDYAEEIRLLQEFIAGFAEYRELDRRILDLAVENTNLKAQRMSFGPAQEAADAFRDALASITPTGRRVAGRGTRRDGAGGRPGDASAAGAAHRRGRRGGDGATRGAHARRRGDGAARAGHARTARPHGFSTARDRRERCPRPVYGGQRRDHGAVTAQYQCAFPRADAE